VTGVVTEDRRRVVVRRIFIVAVVAACLVGLVIAANRTDTGEPDIAQTGGQDVVEALLPAVDSEVLRQAQIGIDLAPGWTGVLIINGTEIPEDQLTIVPELNQVFYQPADGKEVEQLLAGPNCIQAVVWLIERNRGSGQTIDWCFRAT
jgi:hypothetical protein